tara:strand:- start:796 stop:1539 length:744 start_codon:yes stop_codon:yes gene_type:complete
MGLPNSNSFQWRDCQIGITGASGTLGRSLAKYLREKGAYIVGFTHQSTKSQQNDLDNGPHEWVQWECGKEKDLNEKLNNLDILIINHGINLKGLQNSKAINDSLEINALSSWRLIELFEEIIYSRSENQSPKKEVWINTSEAEIQPALSPTYEISKRLIGDLVTIKATNQTQLQKNKLIIRKLILGPFKSNLNPWGLMTSNLVARQIIKQVELNCKLIIVTPNPITYIIMPINEFCKKLYSKLMNQF